MMLVVQIVGGYPQGVLLCQAPHPRHWNQVPAAKAPHLALNPALLVGALDSGSAEEGVEAEVRARGGEAVALDPIAPGRSERAA